MYSIIETARANKLNVFQYLYMVLLYMPDYKNESAGIEMLLPWSDFIKEHCTGLIDIENITLENHEPLPLWRSENPLMKICNTVVSKKRRSMNIR